MTGTIRAEDLPTLVGRELDPSPWLEITQERVNQFAEATNDFQFIHVDPEKAAQTPFGGPIAHGYLSLSLLSYLNAQAGIIPSDAVMGINYVISWVAYPLIMVGVTDLLNRRQQYIRFIVAYNWASVIQVAVTLPAATLLALSGAETFAGFVFFTVMVAVLVYAWFIAKEALDIPGLVASGLVALDVALQLFLNMVSDIMTGRI